MEACTSKHGQVCTHCGIRWGHFPNLFASFVCDFICTIPTGHGTSTAAWGIALECDSHIFWNTTQRRTHQQISEHSIFFYQCFPQDNIQYRCRRPLSTHIMRNGLAVEIPQGKWWPSIRAARLDFCWWNWTWSLLLWCWLWGISILLNKAGGSLFFLPTGGKYLQCNMTRKQQGRRKGGEKVSDDFFAVSLFQLHSPKMQPHQRWIS